MTATSTQVPAHVATRTGVAKGLPRNGGDGGASGESLDGLLSGSAGDGKAKGNDESVTGGESGVDGDKGGGDEGGEDEGGGGNCSRSGGLLGEGGGMVGGAASTSVSEYVYDAYARL